jgi:hypothetical protein
MPVNPMEWITPALAFLALIISVFSLWYTSLKGPDIVLCEEPKFSLDEIPRENFDRFIPHTLSSEAHLLFLNNGTVSGVLRLHVSFEPTAELKLFFDKANFSFTVDNALHERSMPPISIREKEGCMIVIRLSIQFVNWKKGFANEPVPKGEIGNVLRKADWENKRRFHDFCAVLKPGMHIGKVSIGSNQTVRRRLSGTKMAQRSLVSDQSTGVIAEDLISNFRSSATKWDAIDPDAVLTELRAIHDDFDRLLREPLEQNIKKLMGLELSSLHTDLFQAMKRRCMGYDNRAAIVDFITHSSGLDSRLSEYDTKTGGWNRKFNLSKENPLNKNLEEALRKEMKPLEQESLMIASGIAQVQKILEDCYLPSS